MRYLLRYTNPHTQKIKIIYVIVVPCVQPIVIPVDFAKTATYTNPGDCLQFHNATHFANPVIRKRCRPPTGKLDFFKIFLWHFSIDDRAFYSIKNSIKL